MSKRLPRFPLVLLGVAAVFTAFIAIVPLLAWNSRMDDLLQSREQSAQRYAADMPRYLEHLGKNPWFSQAAPADRTPDKDAAALLSPIFQPSLGTEGQPSAGLKVSADVLKASNPFPPKPGSDAYNTFVKDGPDTAVLSKVHAFTHWSLVLEGETPQPLPITSTGFDFAPETFAIARTHLVRGHANGTFGQASRDVLHLAQLFLRTEAPRGALYAFALVESEAKARAAYGAPKTTAPGEAPQGPARQASPSKAARTAEGAHAEEAHANASSADVLDPAPLSEKERQVFRSLVPVLQVDFHPGISVDTQRAYLDAFGTHFFACIAQNASAEGRLALTQLAPERYQALIAKLQSPPSHCIGRVQRAAVSQVTLWETDVLRQHVLHAMADNLTTAGRIGLGVLAALAGVSTPHAEAFASLALNEHGALQAPRAPSGGH